MLNDKVILITGGTGSFGQKMVRTIVAKYLPKKLIVFSRDELKQSKMSDEFPIEKYDFIRYFLGDVRDEKRLMEAFRGVDYVIHAAAIKQVPAAEYNPFEAIKTNILGAQNIISAAIERNVQRVIALSTDKAASPINLYGATKLCSDKLFIAGNQMSGRERPIFSAVRYGNVLGSRGSVLPLFLKHKSKKFVPITDLKMTRFSITLQQGVDFVLRCLEMMHGGELFVPKLPSYRITDMAAAAAPNVEIKVIGIRPGEKRHEVMVPADEAWNTLEYDDYFVIQPNFDWWDEDSYQKKFGGTLCGEDFSYSSSNNTDWLEVDRLREMIEIVISENHFE